MSAGSQQENESMDKNDVGPGYIALKIGDTVQAGDQRYLDFCWVPVPKQKIGTVLKRMHWPMRRKSEVQVPEAQVSGTIPKTYMGPLVSPEVPKETVDPGPGYRLLAPGETVLEGDECTLNGRWKPSIAWVPGNPCMGRQVPSHKPYRRKVSESLAVPTPIPSTDNSGACVPLSKVLFAPVLEGSKDTHASDFLRWVADRLVHVHGNPENVDFVLRLRELANQLPELPKLFTPNKYTRGLVALDGRKVPVDVYCVSGAFALAPVIQNEEALDALFHARKKILAPGQRGAKGVLQDLKEARQSLSRAITVLELGAEA
jgi:hypothetical protein